jgi:hypothetical protein
MSFCQSAVSRRARFDQCCGDVDRVVVGSGKVLDCTRNGPVEPIGQSSDFRHRNRLRLQMIGTLTEYCFKNEGDGRAARRYRGRDTSARRYRQLVQCVQVAEPAALRLLEKLALEVYCR